MIRITGSYSLDETALDFRFIRASGPGGQHVNTTASAVQLFYDPAPLPDAMRQRLLRLAGRRATQEGKIVIAAQRFRSQDRNRADAIDRLVAMLREAAIEPVIRRATRPTLASKKRRLEGKNRRGTIKALRRTDPHRD